MELIAKNAEEAHEVVERLAKEKAVADVRRIETMEIGQVVRQGDIYIHRVSDSHPHGTPTPTNQLAIGETLGSRHVAQHPAKVYQGEKLPHWCALQTFLGPCIASVGTFTITHPEHAHVELPAGTYQITHQMDARTGNRVID